MEILKELAKTWGSLSSMKQAPIIDAIGGKYRGNMLLSLIENFDMYEKMLTEYANASGSAMRENEIRMDSWQTKINQLQNSMSEFWNNSIDTNLVKNFIDFLNAFVKIFGNLPTIILVAVSALALWRAGALLSISTTGKLSGSIVGLIAQMRVLAIVTKTYGVSTTVFGAGLQGLWGIFRNNPIGITITALTLLFSAFEIGKYLVGSWGEKSKEEFDKLTRSITDLKKETAEISGLINTYESLSDNIGKTTEQKSKLAEATQRLADLFPQAITAYDEEGKAIEIDIAYVKELRLEKQKLLQVEQESLGSKYNTEAKDQFFDLSKKQKRLQDIEREIANANEIISQINSGTRERYDSSGGESVDVLQQQYDAVSRLKEVKAKLISETSQLQSAVTEETFAYDQSTDSVNKLSKSLISVTTETMSKTLTSFERTKEILENLADSGASENIKEIFNNVSKGTTSADEGLALINDLLIENGFSAYEASVAVGIFAKSLLLPEGKEANKILQDMTVSSEDLSKSLKEIDTVAKDVSEAMREYNENGKFSVETIMELIEKYPELIAQMKIENGQIILNKEAVQNLTEIRINGLISQLEAEKSFTEGQAKETENRIKNILAEAEALKLKNSVMNSISKNLGIKTLQPSTGSIFIDPVAQMLSQANSLQEQLNQDAGINNKIAVIRALLGQVSSSSKSGIYGASDKEKEKKADEPNKSLNDYYDALIRTTRANATLTDEKMKSIQADIESAKEAENYNVVLQKTNELLNLQKLKTEQLQASTKELQWEFNHQAERSGFDTSKWFDAQGEATVEYTRQYLASSKSVQESMEQTFTILQKLKKAWLENDNAIKEMSTSQIELGKTLNDLRGQMAETIIEAIKKAYEMQKEIAVKALEEEMEAEERRHDRKMRNLDNELKKLQRTHETEDYGKNLAKAQQEALELQAQIDALALDNSIEAKAKREELLKQLAEKQEEIAEMQNDREYELREQNLEDQKEAEDQQYEDTIDRIEDEIKAEEYKYNELINAETKFAQMREDIISGNLDNIKVLMQGFLDAFAGMNAETAGQIGVSWSAVLDTINSIQLAQGTATTLEKPTVYVRSNAFGVTDKKILQAQYGDQIKIEVNDEKAAKFVGADRYQTADLYATYLKQFGIFPDLSVDISKIYKKGGDIDYTGLAWVDGSKDKPEGILTSDQNKLWKQFIDDLPQVENDIEELNKNNKLFEDLLNKFANMNVVDNILGNTKNLGLSDIKVDVKNTENTININNNVNFEVNGSTGITKKDLDTIVKYINAQTVNDLKKRGLI